MTHLSSCTHPQWTSTGARTGSLYQRCMCGKRRRITGARCPGCSHLPFEDRGCDVQGCWQGTVPAPRQRACCCGGPREDRCRNCAESFGLIHVCTVATDAEIDQELAAPTEKRERKPISAATRRRLDELSSGVGERSGQRGNA